MRGFGEGGGLIPPWRFSRKKTECQKAFKFFYDLNKNRHDRDDA